MCSQQKLFPFPLGISAIIFSTCREMRSYIYIICTHILIHLHTCLNVFHRNTLRLRPNFHFAPGTTFWRLSQVAGLTFKGAAPLEPVTASKLFPSVPKTFNGFFIKHHAVVDKILKSTIINHDPAKKKANPLVG